MQQTDQTAGKRRGATIIDVARVANVAVGTVSRYLNGQTIRRSNREQIERAIQDLGYRRNAAAASIRTDLTHMIGFLVPTFDELLGDLGAEKPEGPSGCGWSRAPCR